MPPPARIPAMRAEFLFVLFIAVSLVPKSHAWHIVGTQQLFVECEECIRSLMDFSVSSRGMRGEGGWGSSPHYPVGWGGGDSQPCGAGDHRAAFPGSPD